MLITDLLVIKIHIQNIVNQFLRKLMGQKSSFSFQIFFKLGFKLENKIKIYPQKNLVFSHTLIKTRQQKPYPKAIKRIQLNLKQCKNYLLLEAKFWKQIQIKDKNNFNLVINNYKILKLKYFNILDMMILI